MSRRAERGGTWRGSRIGRGVRLVPTWLVVVAALAVALAWQGLQLQTHQHAPAVEMAAAGQNAGESGPEKPAPPKHTPCLTCIALAHAGSALTAAPTEIAAPFLAPRYPAPPAISADFADRKPPSPWQSRAPPIERAG